MPSVILVILRLFPCIWLTVATPVPTQATPSLFLTNEPLTGDHSTSTKSPATNAESDNYLNRLDFISVIVICAIVAFCFGICVIIGCRRKKRHPSQLDVTDSSQARSITGELRNTNEPRPPRTTNLAYSPSDLTLPESPPPTYSIIERQTSFTSYISQSSSHYEIPPGYDEALSFGDMTNGEPYSRHSSRPGSITGSDILGRRFLPISAARANRSESARARGPPKSRSHRSSSDVGKMRRARLSSNRPATVSEDDTSQFSFATSATGGHETSADVIPYTMNVVADVSFPAQSSTASNCDLSSAEVALPLLPNADMNSTSCNTSVSNCQKKDGQVTRKLTLV